MDATGELTLGRPRLVKALAYLPCFRDRAGREVGLPVRIVAIDEGKEPPIHKGVTHLDELARQVDQKCPVGDRAHARRVVSAGSYLMDTEYVRGLGLVAAQGHVRMANPVYAEAIPSELSLAQQAHLDCPVSPTLYVTEAGGLDLREQLTAFQCRSRDHSESWDERYGHREAGPQLVLHASLQRVSQQQRTNHT